MTKQPADLAEQVAVAIIGLPVKLRTVFVMAYIQCRSREEIAAALGTSERRVERRMTKALIACRKRLMSCGTDLTESTDDTLRAAGDCHVLLHR